MAEAASLAPGNAGLQANLGGLYVESGRPAEAVEHLQKAIEINPRIAIAHWRLGSALQTLGNVAGAIRALEKAVEIRPDLMDAYARLGLLYLEQGRRLDAAEAYRKAAQSAPDPGEKNVLEAHAYRVEGRDSDAESLLRSALQQEPDLPTAHGILGQILAEKGRFDEAAQHYEAQLLQSPDGGLYYYNLVRCRKFTNADDGHLKRMDAVLEDQKLDDRNRAILLLARGKVLDDLGQYREAMAALDEASELRSRTERFEIRDFEKQVDAIIALFSDEAVAKHTSANTDRRPVMFVGMPRAGTTLAEQIIASHRNATGAGELAYWRERLAIALENGEGAIAGDFLAATAAEYLDHLSKVSKTALRVSEKNPFNFLAVGLIYMTFPSAAIVHCRRNPLDTAISIHQTHFSRSAGMPTGGEELVRYFRSYQRLMAHWRRVLPEGRLLEVDYERLTVSPETEIRRLIDYVGLPWDASCLAPHLSGRVVRTPSGWQVRQAINTGSIDRWRHYEPWLGPLAALKQDVA
jgi:tetratricopeptide (TPR) repeat protein